MKKLTVNRIARAGILRSKRAYTGLAAGIFLSIFFISALCLILYGAFAAENQRIHARVGYMDAFYLDGDFSDQQLTDTGYFRNAIGHIHVTANVSKTDVYMGYYDKNAQTLMNRSLASGRMPEKEGEIALEQSAIERMRLSVKVGDTVVLDLVPVDGTPEKRTYIVTGILNEQTSYIDVSANIQSSGRLYRWPEILTSETDTPFDSGRIVIHRALKFQKRTQALQSLRDKDRARFGTGAYAVMLRDGTWTDWADASVFLTLDSSLEVTIMLLSVMGAALLTATAVGISSATESQLARRTEEIGMLRAVGATKKQIRKIFGRESRLLAVTISPAAILSGAFFTRIISLIAPEYILYSFAPMILAPIFVLTFLIIFLSSMLPLRRASRMMPMSVIRDTDLLRKAIRFRRHAHFKAPSLIAGRRLRLNPTRPLGACLLIAAMSTAISIALCMAAYNTDSDYQTMPDYSLSSYFSTSTSFGAIESRASLSEADIEEIKNLPAVKDVFILRTSRINVLLDRNYGYFTPRESLVMLPGTAHFAPEDADYENEPYYRNARKQHENAQRALQTDASLFSMNLIVLSPEDLTRLAADITGKIDEERISTGEEILVYAPNHYFLYNDPEAGPIGGFRHTTWDDGITQWDHIIENDYFTPGMNLSLAQMYVYDEDYSSLIESPDYTAHEKNLFEIRVGAVLSGKGNGEIGLWDPAVITTEEGARALGLVASTVEKVNIHLSGQVAEETEEYLTKRIGQIAMRGSLEVTNNLERARQDRSQRIQAIIAFSSAVIVLFSVSVGMVTGSVTRTITRDERNIGMLRAVGADESLLIKCYTLSAALSVWPGLIIGALFVFLLYRRGTLPPAVFTPAFSLLLSPSLFLFAFFCYLITLLLIKRRIREITHKSIVENIREM